MVGPAEMRQYVAGALMLLRNDRRGFSLLDVTADGFWRSFAAMVYALPAFAVSWMHYRAVFIEETGRADLGIGFLLRLALIDLAAWVLPIIFVALVAPALGVADRFARWTVATNWLTVPLTYVLVVPLVLSSLATGFETVAGLLLLVLFGLALAVLYRVSKLCFDGSVRAAVVVTAGILLTVFIALGILEPALGVALPAQ